MSGLAAQPDPNPYAQGSAFVDGEYCPIGEARIPLIDLGFTRSDATYDVVHVWHGRFFRLQDHLDRFQESCDKLRFDLGYTKQDMADILHRMAALTGLADLYVNITATRGPLPPGERNPLNCRNRLYAYAIPFVWIARPEDQDTGIDMIIASAQRVPMASFDQTVKNYQWGDLTSSLFEAAERGAKIAVLPDGDGNITEGPGINVFACKDGRLMTPDTGVLHGITRRTTLELADGLNIETRVEPLGVETLKASDEIFVTSTAGGIMPVRSLDGVAVGDGAPGPLATRLRQLYWEAHDDPRFSEPVRTDCA